MGIPTWQCSIVSKGCHVHQHVSISQHHVKSSIHTKTCKDPHINVSRCIILDGLSGANVN